MEFNACPSCSFRWCLKANDPAAKCDVCDDVTPERAQEIEKKYMYKEKVIMKRKARGKTPIVFGLKSSIDCSTRSEGPDAEVTPAPEVVSSK